MARDIIQTRILFNFTSVRSLNWIHISKPHRISIPTLELRLWKGKLIKANFSANTIGITKYRCILFLHIWCFQIWMLPTLTVLCTELGPLGHIVLVDVLSCAIWCANNLLFLMLFALKFLLFNFLYHSWIFFLRVTIKKVYPTKTN